ncbi:DUF5372 family protein [Streptomyces xanthophaeus]|uniref:DUF5372 family protein n=1 Tax=Streptomyces xanthophaeus TaxID=67385 RepID=UPI003712A75E
MTGDAAAGQGDAVVVTHPAHPFRGRRLRVRAVRGHGPAEVLVCAGPDGAPMTVLRSWTDRAAPPAAECAAGGGRAARRPLPYDEGGRPFRVSEAALRSLRSSVEETVGRLAGIEAPAGRSSPCA